MSKDSLIDHLKLRRLEVRDELDEIKDVLESLIQEEQWEEASKLLVRASILKGASLQLTEDIQAVELEG